MNKAPNAKMTLENKAYKHIKNRIKDRIYKPGQNILDSKLSAELEISRTPIRDALRRLEHEGFVKGQSGKGWQVCSLTLHDIHEIFNIKITLEGMLAREAGGCKDQKLHASLRNALEKMKKTAVSNDHIAWREADTELHKIIMTMANNKRATRIIEDLNDQWYRIRIGLVAMQGRVEQSNLEHNAFVESLLAGDGEKAEKQVRQHLINVRDEVENILVNLVFPFAENGV